MVDVTVLRNGKERIIPVTLVKIETYKIEDLGLEVRNINKEQLREYGLSNGVLISDIISRDMREYDLEGSIITRMNNQPVKDINDIKRILARRDYGEAIKLTFSNRQGELNSFIFR